MILFVQVPALKLDDDLKEVIVRDLLACIHTQVITNHTILLSVVYRTQSMS